ncbi:universal stress protein [Methanobacterium paludis]|uniref:UspA domain-containing protein n=1 Tax=Methanobacterium paludis (strain DSM 25820 / JCM 18151 / SWAN1) TaxID=868131 RepID=F6D3Z2_METPW|nr:universal stress protein [Methanobacterium paludis]AEG19169.1 UspA domain-containing protein [Methanobacterium paludis]
MNTRILLPTDGSENAERAGEYAISLSNISGADIIVLNVIDTDYLDALPQQDLKESLGKELREEGKKAVERFKESLEDSQCNGMCKNINFTILIKEGKPGEVILKTIDEENIDQVIMGKSGKHGLERFLLGRTTDKVVREANVPVNVIS